MKRKIMNFGVAMLLAAAMCGCGSSFTASSSRDLVDSIHKGMTMEEVRNVMGKPTYRSFIRDSEEWRYEKTHIIGGDQSVIVIGFVDGKVEYLDSFNTGVPGQQSGVRPSVVVLPPHDYQYPTVDEQLLCNRDYDNLVNRLKKMALKDDKLKLVRETIQNGNKYTSRQCVGVMKALDWDEERLEVLGMIVPVLVDRENDDEIVESMDFLSGKESARKILDEYK
ncbi:DUF4476 domain-containing protein [uncultured Bacteroides sp.]|uniref:DUF4476 domain-containing protein n=1 Tax=uncultured Bacteroides sp. TaxID=162156 RepID=UPI00261C4798|nr:DUF4476 domain-containing protein [uncultured Bacteroides sp.]